MYPKIKNIILVLILIVLFTNAASGQNVFIVVIDGARYSETFGSEEENMPFIWNKLRHEGSIYNNFYNEGSTKTLPGHSSILTGTWQKIANDGTEHPSEATVFEYFREQKNVNEDQLYVIAGANKLAAVSYSIDILFGSSYKASVVTNNYTGDLDTYDSLLSVIEGKKPRLVLVNFKQVDIKGHANNWEEYLFAIKQVDSLIYSLWQILETDDYYKDNTTMFVTNDHGRHDDPHGGFKEHGCDCEGCRHIILFGIGKNIPKDSVINEIKYQVDLAPTIADLLSIDFPEDRGTSLLNYGITTQIKEISVTKPESFEVYQNYPNPFNPSTSISYFIPTAGEIKIYILDMLGKEIMLLDQGYKSEGKHSISVDASNLVSGIYFYRIEFGNFIETKKMILVK